MRKLLLIVLMLFTLVGCSGKVVYVSQDEIVVQQDKPDIPFASDFCDMRKLDIKGMGNIYWDNNTDVLYWVYEGGHRFGITPIMKADGTCLTYKEWKRSQDEKSNSQ